MEMGDLEKILSDDGLAERLTCRIRLGIAIGVAKALYYMHHNPGNPIIHRDIKASNIIEDKHVSMLVGGKY